MFVGRIYQEKWNTWKWHFSAILTIISGSLSLDNILRLIVTDSRSSLLLMSRRYTHKKVCWAYKIFHAPFHRKLKVHLQKFSRCVTVHNSNGALQILLINTLTKPTLKIISTGAVCSTSNSWRTRLQGSLCDIPQGPRLPSLVADRLRHHFLLFRAARRAGCSPQKSILIAPPYANYYTSHKKIISNIVWTGIALAGKPIWEASIFPRRRLNSGILTASLERPRAFAILIPNNGTPPLLPRLCKSKAITARHATSDTIGFVPFIKAGFNLLFIRLFRVFSRIC